MHVLIVDDSRAMRAILRDMLQKLGYQTTQAANGREGLERLKEYDDIQLALVDWNMPELNGYEFVCAVREKEEYNNIRLMMVTTETEMSNVEKALTAGADEYVMKPFTREVIVDKLETLGLT